MLLIGVRFQLCTPKNSEDLTHLRTRIRLRVLQREEWHGPEHGVHTMYRSTNGLGDHEDYDCHLGLSFHHSVVGRFKLPLNTQGVKWYISFTAIVL